MKELKQRHEIRARPSLIRRALETVVGIGIIGMVGFLKWKAGLGDLYFGLGLLLGGMFVSRSLVSDFSAGIIDKLRK